MTPFLANADGTVSVRGNGRQLWAPVYRENIVEAIVRALASARRRVASA